MVSPRREQGGRREPGLKGQGGQKDAEDELSLLNDNPGSRKRKKQLPESGDKDRCEQRAVWTGSYDLRSRDAVDPD